MARGNPNPWQGRLAKALKEKPGDLAQAQQRAWGVLCLCYERIGLATEESEQRRWVLAYVQASAAFSKLYEVAELEPRLRAIEKALEEARGPSV